MLAGDGEKEPTVESRRAGLEMSYAQAVSSHSSKGHCSRDSVDSKASKVQQTVSIGGGEVSWLETAAIS